MKSDTGVDAPYSVSLFYMYGQFLNTQEQV